MMNSDKINLRLAGYNTIDKGCLRFFSLVCCLLLVTFTSLAEPVFPEMSGRIVDQANILSDSQRKMLTLKLAQHENKTGNQIVIVTLTSLQGLEISQFGYQLTSHYKLGEKARDNGVLLIVAPSERKVRIEVGYGLEGALTDIVSSQIIRREIVPHFRNNDFAKGIEAGTQAILDTVIGEYKAVEIPKINVYLPNTNEVFGLIKVLFFFALTLVVLRHYKLITPINIVKVLIIYSSLLLAIWLFFCSTQLLTTSLAIANFVTLFTCIPILLLWATTKFMTTLMLIFTQLSNSIILVCSVYIFNDLVTAGFFTIFFAVAAFFICLYLFPVWKSSPKTNLFIQLSFIMVLIGSVILLDSFVHAVFVSWVTFLFIILPLSQRTKSKKKRGRKSPKITYSSSYHDTDSYDNSSDSSSSSSSNDDQGFSGGGGSFGGGGASGSW